MIRKYKVLFIIMFIVLLMSLQFVDAKIKPKMTLTGKIITIDPGHGGYLYTRCNKTSEKAL